jgi:predicted Zn-dependent protease
MTASRIDVFEQILQSDPANTAVLFGLAKEYEKAGRDADLIEALKRYLENADDEGNAYGMLARAYERLSRRSEAREIYQRGAEAALAHGHPSMAEEYRSVLENDYETVERL